MKVEVLFPEIKQTFFDEVLLTSFVQPYNVDYKDNDDCN